jgi:hypothetical protein
MLLQLISAQTAGGCLPYMLGGKKTSKKHNELLDKTPLFSTL